MMQIEAGREPQSTGAGAAAVAALRVRKGRAALDRRAVPQEAAVALVHDASTTAVMMATPADLEDFAIGFSLTEGVIESLDDILDLDVVERADGWEARIWLAARRSAALTARRRRLAGPTGCGLCGVESLAEAARAARPAPPGGEASAADVQAALSDLTAAQALGAVTRAVHAAGWWSPGEGYVCLREDVGRHNALDKLAGALARREAARPEGLLVLTSRVSVEMVQKAAAMGAPILVAISAPTSLAVRTAEAAGVTLVAVARDDGFEVFSHPDRIVGL
ncbi:MAG: formate dehydrogenase accessory sulfurtransferase FdhD [Phenylobacterium sp.]|uniref:formate dehydrogenase accessory sulfurtransferase FdhD n=1 Tax=Phenylobacterium sp. TaxID=1871053 RepID=UPI00391AB4B6